MNTRRTIVAFVFPGQGHLNRMLPVVSGLCGRGIQVVFYAPEPARPFVERTGAQFRDIFGGRPMEVPDDASTPLPVRCVSFAGYWGDQLTQEVAALNPALILHDSFALVARVVGYHLKIPRVAMRAGHNQRMKMMMAEGRVREPVHIAPACESAVAALRERHGIPDATPFSFLADDPDVDLNIVSEPPEFLPPGALEGLEPVEFFGSCWPEGEGLIPELPDPFGPDAGNDLRVYVGFGGTAWMICPDQALARLEALADGIAGQAGVRGLISLGGPMGPGAAERLTRPNVRVETFVNQTGILRHADLFVTHHGLNSTHEAVFSGVPMISCPLFGDQPGMAARCAELGLALPLAGPGEPLTAADVRRVLDRARADLPALRARVAQAREWERAVMARRAAVLDRIIEMMR